MREELFLNVGVVVGEDIYFTILNSGYLYKYSLSENKIRIEQKLPWQSKKKFCAMQIYKNQIWMIPAREEEIWIYDIENKEMIHRCLPQRCDVCNKNLFFKRVIQKDEYIWAIPFKADYILQINMNTNEYLILEDWPAEVEWEEGQMFETGSYYKGKLYLLHNSCNENVVIEVNAKKIETWDVQVEGQCIEIIDEKLFVFSREKGGMIQIYNLKNNYLIFEKQIKEIDRKKDLNKWLYWKIVEIGEKLFFLPHEADFLMIMDKKTYEIKYVSLQNKEHKSTEFNLTFSVQGIYLVDKKFVVISNSGDNQFVILNHDCEVEEIITLQTDKVEYGDELSSYIEHKVLKSALRWNNEKDTAERIDLCEETVGKKIYSYLQ